MKPAIETDEVGHIGIKPHRLPHKKDFARRMQWREGGIVLHFVDQLNREALVFCDLRSAAHHAMPDCNGVYKRWLTESFRNQGKSRRNVANDRLFVNELGAVSPGYPGFHPELS